MKGRGLFGAIVQDSIQHRFAPRRKQILGQGDAHLLPLVWRSRPTVAVVLASVEIGDTGLKDESPLVVVMRPGPERHLAAPSHPSQERPFGPSRRTCGGIVKGLVKSLGEPLPVTSARNAEGALPHGRHNELRSNPIPDPGRVSHPQ
jgi:hypothetical protein